MSAVDYIILGVIALLLAAAVYSIIRRRKSGKGCCGCCAECMHKCETQQPDKKTLDK